MNDPSGAKLIQRGGTKDMRLGSADREIGISVVGVISIVVGIGGAGQIPGRTFRTMEDAIKRILRREHCVHAVVNTIDSDIVRLGRDEVGGAVRQSNGSAVGWGRQER